MASLFRARRRRSPEDEGDDGDGSGSGRGKRRRLSPEEGALVPAEAGRSPGWLSTIVTGAKRVISSVLFSSSEEQASGDEEEEEEEDGSEQDSGELLPLPHFPHCLRLSPSPCSELRL
uniref:Uncharacterized protein n=1 Tax=Aegilops tauschii subsp. strangulata TaxID=200361 RepID=A0A453D6A9_AEGTS